MAISPLVRLQAQVESLLALERNEKVGEPNRRSSMPGLTTLDTQ